ncbi:MAG TPA: PQQ-binding-like beta-propeller repeat protein [Gemmataceae bacterium]|jgi:outer membrane protein assembly factor BamB
MKARLFFPVAVFALALLPALRADDWPQWRGPERTGLSKETGLLTEWPKDGPKLLWQIKDIGGGYSTPAVVGERIYLMADRKEDEFVLALDAATGKEIWAVAIGKIGKNTGPQHPGARSTPTMDGDRMFVLGSDGDLACLKTDKGEIVWKKNLKDDFEGKPGAWAYSESPLVDGDAVVCTPGGKEATLVALNKNTGETIWKSAVPEGDQAAYASAIAVEVGGVKQYVQFLQKGVVGVDAKSGKFLWRFDKTTGTSPANIPTPVAHDGYIYSATGFGGGGLAKLKVEKDEVTAEQVYAEKTLPNCIGGTVRVGDFLYGATAKELLCVEFTTGSIRWHEKGVGAGSVCYADGCLYVHGENGEVLLVEATPDGYHEKGRFTPPDPPKRGSSKAWAYPVVANGRLYLRDLGVLWCYDVKVEKDKK